MIGRISRLQHFSVGDGPGIRSTVFFQGCNLHCDWCHNPETIPLKAALLFYRERCTACGHCVQACSKKCHRSASGCHAFSRTACNLCGACVEACTPQALERCGQEMTLDEVFRFIEEDQDFYAASGGGVTLSGGEPLLQADFCGELVKKCRESKINTVIDTAGNIPYTAFEKILADTSMFYYDIKAAEEDYQAWTGGDGARIFANLKQLIADGADVTARIPMIPQYNLSPDYAERMILRLRSCGVKKVHLLPFHRLGSGKYQALGREYTCAGLAPPRKEDLEQLLILFSAAFEAAIAG